MKRVLTLLALLLLSGCETLSYYTQAIGGQMSFLASARPLDAWLADPATPDDLRARLRTAQEIRAFASRELGLPDNASYRSYADLGRPFVVWNVFATPEFSVEPKRECFPFTGCVPYLGFFSETAARAHAAKLKRDGLDVHLGGVLAYSTLGWFSDPLLSTFIRYPEAQVARLVFHELAHQVAYASGDTTFNESFAVVVEEEGVRRWLAAHGHEQDLKAFHAAQARKRAFATAVKETRDRLAAVYASGEPAEVKRSRKREEFDRLREQFPGAVPAQPNNAFLASVALYTEMVPGFEQLLAESGGDLKKFYAEVQVLAHSDRSVRDAALARLGESAKSRDPAQESGMSTTRRNAARPQSRSNQASSPG
jgi:predicted aminopeptidase